MSEKGAGGSKPGGRVAGRQGAESGRGTAGVGREKVRKSNKVTQSQRAWLERQLNDPYVQRAKREGYRSRAAYKLIEIDDKHRFLKPGGRVLDLGAAPGGWSQVAAQRVGRATGKGIVVGIDILPMEPLPGVELAELDFTAEDAPERLVAMMGGKADVVMSDMAANATGHRQTDHLKIMGLLELASEFAMKNLKTGGAYVAKAFQGGETEVLLRTLKVRFDSVKHFKPKSSRADSSEIYIVATGFKG